MITKHIYHIELNAVYNGATYHEYINHDNSILCYFIIWIYNIRLRPHHWISN